MLIPPLYLTESKPLKENTFLFVNLEPKCSSFLVVKQLNASTSELSRNRSKQSTEGISNKIRYLFWSTHYEQSKACTNELELEEYKEFIYSHLCVANEWPGIFHRYCMSWVRLWGDDSLFFLSKKPANKKGNTVQFQYKSSHLNELKFCNVKAAKWKLCFDKFESILYLSFRALRSIKYILNYSMRVQ